ncbi:Uu.00g089950.m01.CDS01 [Anthostomella pinea]|uniref:Uu.00g089950.m01.CDS01 n=1 Tax=Anthostomella pinea TaxID=933095 RepID=A0AAI8VMS5_9PEZI|nr:Uu.00g089950.m01.CDS01 [Anthostomella pinea]
MSLQRSATRKAGSVPAKRKKDYDIVQQGIKELYPSDKPNVVPDIDIVLVPGLGGHPERSWMSESTKFNWTTDALVRDFPRARILLYEYESAWRGSLKIKQFMSNIAMTLLVGLKSKREGCSRRPIVFIGHSMGGLVVAKAITIADSRRDKFPIMFEAIAASIFFGTPFNGAPVASVAAMYAQFAEKIGAATASKLLDLMKPGDEALRELKHEFMRLVGKLNPKIDCLCFYEEQPTDFSKMAGLPGLFGLSKLAIPSKYAEFVSRDSATLPGVEECGLACNHRDLVKFDGPKDNRWSQLVRDPLKSVIHGAHLAVKNRLNSVRDIDRTMVSGIMDALEGVQLQKKRKILAQTFAQSSWITKEAEYTQWLVHPGGDPAQAAAPRGECLWIRGPEGRGKTSASMAAIDEVETLIRINDEENTGQDPILLVYFFCDSTAADCSTAEDLLKSLVRQLISQQETLAPYAKSFAKKKTKEEGSKSQAQVTVENLWQSLQDMLTDEFIGSKVFFVLNNLHALPEDSDSTIKLMNYINAELQTINSMDTKRVPTRWFITSREAHNLDQALKVDGVRLIDLEDEKYGDQVQMSLRKHAKDKVSTLEQAKKYNKALAYFASSLIGKRAQNTQWIDITCVQLEELPQAESDLKVRRVLETMPQDLQTLLNNAWLQVFQSSGKEAEKIKEMLRALVITYEDPTEAVLGVLAGLCSSEEEKAELHGLIEKCKPLITIKRDGTVCFMNIVVKTHLLENSKQLLGLSTEEIKWQHGILALRSFTHIKEKFDFEPEAKPEVNPDGDANEVASDHGGEADDGDSNNDEESDEEEEDSDDEQDSDSDSDDDDDASESEESEDDPDPEADILEDRAMPYAVKYWLRHASKATREIAEDLSLERDFWMPGSRIRHRWLVEYCRMTSTFDDFDYKSLTGLHIAASIGFRRLVAALIRNGYEDEIKTRDSLINTPLHFAAFFGRPKIVEELLNKGAVIDDGDDIGEQTPLHMAAFGGHVEVMKKLLLRGANPNATTSDIGPVVNAAISSGNRAAVELLVEKGVSLMIVDRPDLDAPLALAALLSDVSMFEYLIQKYADKLPATEYSKALVKSAEAGRIEVFNKLLEFQHSQEYFQEALDAAVGEWNWDIVTVLLERRPGLDCNNLFYEAATGTEPQDKILEVVWQYTNGSISPETLNKSLYDATDREKESTVKLLLEKFGANPNATGDDYGNALTAAAYDGTMEIIDLLLNAGADVNAPEGWAIQSAAAEGHHEVVEKLLEKGANVNAFTTNENFEAGTALQGACEAGKADIVSLLLEHNANPNLGGGTDSPPIIAAAMRAEEEILAMLVKAKADLDVFGGYDMSSPLINAAAYMPRESLQILLDAGANINLPDRDGDTALIVASRRGDEEAVTFLLDSGADIMHASKENENALHAALENENEDCMRVLVDRVTVLFGALKTAMDSGNTAAISIVRSVASSKQGLSYDEEPPTADARGSKQASEHGGDTDGDDGGDDDDDDEEEEEGGDGGDEDEGSQQDDDTPSTHPGEAEETDGNHDKGEAENQSAFEEQQVFNVPDTTSDLPEDLRAAIGTQVSLLTQFSPRNTEEQAAAPDAVPEQPSYHRQSDWQIEPEHNQYAASQQRSQEPTTNQSQPVQQAQVPAELPGQAPIKRKPAPRASYDGQSSLYTQTPSPQPLNVGYKPPPIAPYRPSRDNSSFQGAQTSQPTPAYPSPQQQQPTPPPASTAAYQNIQAYQPSQSSQAAPAAAYQAPSPYQGASMYDGSHYGDASGSSSQQTYAAYHPDPYGSNNSTTQQQQVYNSDGAVQAYQPQLYHEQSAQTQAQQYQGYYGGSPNLSADTYNNTTTQQQHQQHQQYDEIMYAQGGADWDDASRPQLKQQRSSFLVGGMKNTFDKAKLMGNGMFARKP